MLQDTHGDVLHSCRSLMTDSLGSDLCSIATGLVDRIVEVLSLVLAAREDL